MMKSVVARLLVIVLLPMLVLPASAPANLLANPGFEIGVWDTIDSWSRWGSAYLETWAKLNGTNGVGFHGWSSGGGVYQDVSAAGSSNYIFSAWGLMETQFPASQLTVEMKLEFFNSGGTNIHSVVALVTGSPAWSQYSIAGVAPLETAVVRPVIAFGGTAGTAGGFKWDDADLVSQPASGGATTYVSTNGANVYPYTNSATAANNIQAAVDAAFPSGTVRVADGRYPLGIPIVVHKPLTIQSVNGAAATIVDGMHRGRCFMVTDPGVVIDGFTVTNGYESVNTNRNIGGGILAEHGGAIRNCRIAGCTVIDTNAEDWAGDTAGGGVYLVGGGEVANCEFYGNRAAGGVADGGGLYAEDAAIAHCSFRDNRASGGSYFYYTGYSGSGGGLWALRCAVRDCSFSNNIASGPSTMYGAPGNGGGACCREGSVTGCVFVGNLAQGGSGSRSQAPGCGGGLYLAQGATARNCLAQDNRTICGAGWGPASGGGVYLTATSSLYSSRIVGNIATGDSTYVSGGGVFCADSSLLANSIVAHNGALGYYTGYEHRRGGGVYCSGSWIVNCTIVSNRSTSTLGGGVYLTNNGWIDNSVVYYNVAATYTTNTWHNVCIDTGSANYCCAMPAPSGAGNITNAPAFLDLNGGDFHLLSASPCIDAGSGAGGTAPSSDIEGMPRPLDGNNDGVPAFDIGAYEFIHPDADTDHDGLTDTNELAATGTNPTNEDTDDDRMNDGNEVTAGTDPTDSESVLEIASSESSDWRPQGIVISWSSVAGRQYRIERTANLLAGFSTLVSAIPATEPLNVHTDLTATAGGPYYYRIGVE